MPQYLLNLYPTNVWPEHRDPPEGGSTSNKLRIGTLGTNQIWGCYDSSDPITKYNLIGSVICAWNWDGTLALDEEGEPLFPPTADYAVLRPLGNAPDGLATKNLRYTHPAGAKQEWLEKEQVYPVTNDAMAIDTRYWWDPTAGWEGWGWRSEIVHTASNRPPQNRAIGIYTDVDCSDYLYTTGAFKQEESHWQVDEDGNPLTVWATNNPPGRVNPEKEPVHFSLLHGAEQEGHSSLYANGDEEVKLLYWEHDQQEELKNLFIASFEAIPGAHAERIKFNRLILSYQGEELRLSWGRLLHGRYNSIADEFQDHITTTLTESGMR